jgi:sarcosine/dimethylglycine N-methyltransferase
VTLETALRDLRARGIAPEHARAEDLHVIDMNHMGGLAAADELANAAGIGPGQRVLDVGSGVGGPARRFAERFGAQVSAVELSGVLNGTSAELTALVRLTDRVRPVQGSALALPFSDAGFDAVVMQHVAMQIDEKDRLFGELARVLRPGGCLALHELFCGPGILHYPLPCATEPSMSALETVESCRERLIGMAFDVGEFVDHSERGRRFHLARIATFDEALGAGEGALGLTRAAAEARRAASVAMEKNLGSGSIRVGMFVSWKQG